ncbi:MAG TPA: protein kinase [Kofleriaceae bacterium]
MTGVDPLIGRDLDGRYTIVDNLGRGGMGAVYRATQHGLGREVAIKVVTPRLGTNEVIIKRFLREAKLASKLTHPNAVAVLDFGQTSDELIYLVMELVVGRTLQDVVASEPTGKLAPARVVHIGTQICSALAGAHAMQIVHRDLKPSNIMLSTAGSDVVKVLDFGLAKSLADASGAALTSAGSVIGTPAFMPPEAVTGGVVDARADLYSLGCTLYYAAMGRLPFESTAVAEMIAMHATEAPPPLAGVPVGLAAVIEQLLAKDPAQRYPDAVTARDALERSLAVSREVVKGTPRTPAFGTMLGWATPASKPGLPRAAQPASSPSNPAVSRGAHPSSNPGVQPSSPGVTPAKDRTQPIAKSSAGGYRVAWLVIVLVVLASAGLVVYTLLTR